MVPQSQFNNTNINNPSWAEQNIIRYIQMKHRSNPFTVNTNISPLLYILLVICAADIGIMHVRAQIMQKPVHNFDNLSTNVSGNDTINLSPQGNTTSANTQNLATRNTIKQANVLQSPTANLSQPMGPSIKLDQLLKQLSNPIINSTSNQTSNSTSNSPLNLSKNQSTKNVSTFVADPWLQLMNTFSFLKSISTSSSPIFGSISSSQFSQLKFQPQLLPQPLVKQSFPGIKLDKPLPYRFYKGQIYQVKGIITDFTIFKILDIKDHRISLLLTPLPLSSSSSLSSSSQLQLQSPQSQSQKLSQFQHKQKNTHYCDSRIYSNMLFNDFQINCAFDLLQGKYNVGFFFDNDINNGINSYQTIIISAKTKSEQQNSINNNTNNNNSNNKISNISQYSSTRAKSIQQQIVKNVKLSVNFNVFQIKWDSTADITIMTFTQGKITQKLLFSGGTKLIYIPYYKFIQFRPGTVNLTITQVNSTDGTYYGRYQQQSKPYSVKFTAVQHKYRYVQNQFITFYGTFPSTAKINQNITVELGQKKQWLNRYVFLCPTDFQIMRIVKTIQFQKQILLQNEILNFTIQTFEQGTCYLGLYAKNGTQILNYPIYVGNNVYPLIPDALDLSHGKICNSQYECAELYIDTQFNGTLKIDNEPSTEIYIWKILNGLRSKYSKSKLVFGKRTSELAKLLYLNSTVDTIPTLQQIKEISQKIQLNYRFYLAYFLYDRNAQRNISTKNPFGWILSYESIQRDAYKLALMLNDKIYQIGIYIEQQNDTAVQSFVFFSRDYKRYPINNEDLLRYYKTFKQSVDGTKLLLGMQQNTTISKYIQAWLQTNREVNLITFLKTKGGNSSIKVFNATIVDQQGWDFNIGFNIGLYHGLTGGKNVAAGFQGKQRTNQFIMYLAYM